MDLVSWECYRSLPLHKLTTVVSVPCCVRFLVVSAGDRMHPGVVVLATAVHFCCAGNLVEWWISTELVDWGLVTNVAGASLSVASTGPACPASGARAGCPRIGGCGWGRDEPAARCLHCCDRGHCHPDCQPGVREAMRSVMRSRSDCAY